jgi:hypothetical protein
LGDFPPNGRLFTLCSYLKITQIAHILGYVLYSKERGYALILTKNAFNKKGRARPLGSGPTHLDYSDGTHVYVEKFGFRHRISAP